jgi:hypothetical protein
MSSLPLTYEVRVIVCNHCGAPVHGLPSGGEFTCTFCQVVNTVRARRDRAEDFRAALAPDADAGKSELSEPARIASLRAQVAAIDPLTSPPGNLHRYFRIDVSDVVLTDLQPRWNEQRRRIEAGAGKEDLTHLRSEERFTWAAPRHPHRKDFSHALTRHDSSNGPRECHRLRGQKRARRPRVCYLARGRCRVHGRSPGVLVVGELR